MYQPHYSASNARNLGTTKTYVEGNKSETNVEKRTNPIMKMNARWKRDVQIVLRTIQYSLKLVACIKRKNEIMQFKYKRNISFRDARKIVESYMGTQSYASISRKTNRIQQTDSKQENEYIELIEKLVRLSASEWLNFQEQQRKSYLAAWGESKGPETDNVVKTENRKDSPTMTIPPKKQQS